LPAQSWTIAECVRHQYRHRRRNNTMTQTLNQPDHESGIDERNIDEPADMSVSDNQPAAEQFDPELWVEAIKTVSSHYRLEYSVEGLRVAAAWAKDDAPIEVITRLARHAGLSCAPGKVDRKSVV